MDKHIQSLINQFKNLLQIQKLSHAHILECPINKPVDDVILGIISASLCATKSGCGQCQSCKLLTNDTHPDLIRLSNLQQGIKVAEIRDLTQLIYQAPKIANYRMIVIRAVDRLNHSAANALLKILEEPPIHVIFILTCKNISCVTATIRSRAVQWRLPVSLTSEEDWKFIAKWLIDDEGKSQLLKDREILIEQINAVYEQKKQPYEIAHAWQRYAVYDLLWLLYLIHAWALRQNYVVERQVGYFGDNALLLKKIYQIHAMIKLVNQGVALNNILMYETLLIDCKGHSE